MIDHRDLTPLYPFWILKDSPMWSEIYAGWYTYIPEHLNWHQIIYLVRWTQGLETYE